MVWGVILGPQMVPKSIKKNVFFLSLFSHAFCWHVFSSLGPFFSPFAAIFDDFWTLGTPKNTKIRWEVLHFSERSLFLIFYRNFRVFLESSSIFSRFWSILASFLVPKSPKIAKNGGSEWRSKIDRSKRDPRGPPGVHATH